MRLADKTALITGAGSGMGRLACQLFAREGASIVALDITEDALRETAASVEAEGGRILAVTANVSVAADVERAVAEGVRAFGGLHVLYNNAGIFPDEDQSVVDMDEGVWQRVLDVNLKGVALCCKYGIPELIKAGGGSVINVASFVALVGCTVPQDAYTASKGAVALPHPLPRRPVRAAGRARQRHLPGADPDADAGVALPQRGGEDEAAEPHPDGPLRPGGGHRLRRALPRLRRVVLDDGHGVRGGRRHHRQLLLRDRAGWRCSH